VKITDNTSVKAKTGDGEEIMVNFIWLNCRTVYKSLFTSELSEDLNYGPWSYAM